jgi:hypothetical protein
MMKHAWALAALVMLGITTSAQASVTIVGDTANSESGLGDFEATLTYLSLNDTSATLTIEITNTTPVANGGALKALAFVNPGNVITSASMVSSAATLPNLLGSSPFQNGISVSPYGSLDIGASSGSAWLGAAGDLGGLAVGQSATLTYTLGGLSGLAALTEMSFLTVDADSDYAFTVRFREFNGGGSDKVPFEVVPEPASLLVWSLIGLGAIPGAVLYRRRKS